jgi:hypothetical protein
MKPEASFSARVRKGLAGLDIDRIENRVNLGISDMLVGAGRRFAMMELKVVQGYAVGLRPHQIAFLTRHALAGRPCFVLILWKASRSRPDMVCLYRGLDAVALAEHGMRIAPLAAWPSHGMPWGELEQKIISESA